MPEFVTAYILLNNNLSCFMLRLANDARSLVCMCEWESVCQWERNGAREGKEWKMKADIHTSALGMIEGPVVVFVIGSIVCLTCCPPSGFSFIYSLAHSFLPWPVPVDKRLCWSLGTGQGKQMDRSSVWRGPPRRFAWVVINRLCATTSPFF